MSYRVPLLQLPMPRPLLEGGGDQWPGACGTSCECRLARPASSAVDPLGMEVSKWRKMKAAQHPDDEV